MKRISLVFFFLFFSGCSLISIGYGYLDSLLLNRFHHFLDLTNSQEEEAEKIVTKVVHWHKTTQLPQYIVFLSQIQTHLKTQNTKEGLDYVFKGYIQFRNEIFQTVISNVSTLVFASSMEQKKHLISKLVEEDDEIKDYLSLPLIEQREKRIEDHLELLTDWVGELSGNQKQAMITFIDQVPDLEPLRLQHHKNIQKELLTFFEESGHTAQEFKQKLLSLRIPEPSDPRPYNQAAALNQIQYYKFFVTFTRGLTSEQRQYMIREIENIKQDLIQL